MEAYQDVSSAEPLPFAKFGLKTYICMDIVARHIACVTMGGRTIEILLKTDNP